MLAAAVAVVVVAGAVLAWARSSPGAPGAPPPSLGSTADLRLPAAVLDAPLVDQAGRPVTLRAWRGRVVVLVPFLTSCQEVCPLTTAALLAVQRAVGAAGLGRRIAVVEVSIDPERDTPPRLVAYRHLTGATWPMLTGAPATMASFWRALGVYAQQVPEGEPPGVDWQTGRPYAYDVDHADGFILLAGDQHERFVTLGAPDLRGRSLSGPLAAMLDAQGQVNLRHPGPGAWTVTEALGAIGWLAGRTVAPVG